jgi:hypothetical protein
MKNITEPQNPVFQIRSLTKKELANLYGVSPYILRTWLKAHPELQRQERQKVFTIKEVEKIFEVFGIPSLPKIAA